MSNADKTYHNSLQAAGFIQQTPLVNLLRTLLWPVPSLAQQPTSLYSSLFCLAAYFPQPLQAKWEACSRMTTCLTTLESVLCMSVFPIRQERPEAAANTPLILLLKHGLKSKQGSYHCESFSGRNSKPSNPIWSYFLLKGLSVTWTCIQTLDKHVPLLKYVRAIWFSLFLINVRPGALTGLGFSSALLNERQDLQCKFRGCSSGAHGEVQDGDRHRCGVQEYWTSFSRPQSHFTQCFPETKVIYVGAKLGGRGTKQTASPKP